MPLSIPEKVELRLVDVSLLNPPVTPSVWPYTTVWSVGCLHAMHLVSVLLSRYQHEVLEQHRIALIDLLAAKPMFNRAGFPHTKTRINGSAQGRVSAKRMPSGLYHWFYLQVQPFSSANAALISCLWLSASDEQAVQLCTSVFPQGADPNCQHYICGTDAHWGAWDCCETPIHIASGKGWGRCVQLLVQHGADVENQNGSGECGTSCAETDTSCVEQGVLRWQLRFNMGTWKLPCCCYINAKPVPPHAT